MTTDNERRPLTEPLESVTRFFGALMIIAALVGAAFLVFGSGGTYYSTLGEQALNVVAALPAVLFWGGVLFLLWRMMVTARRNGPFTPRVASAVRRLGWFIIIGSTTAAVVHLIAIDALLTIMATIPNPWWDLLLVPVHLPIPVLTGAALLTFARIVRAGAVMEDEIQATI